MLFATIAAWVAWIVVLVAINPTSSGWLGFLFFFLTFGMALMGTLSLAGTYVRLWMKRDELVSRHVYRSFRQAVLLSVLAVGALLLLGRGLFTWWTALLFILALSLVEMAFLGAQRPRG